MYQTDPQKQELEIPRACPNCQGKLFVIAYDAVLNFLKTRNWIVCKSCNYEQQLEDFKKELWCQ